MVGMGGSAARSCHLASPWWLQAKPAGFRPSLQARQRNCSATASGVPTPFLILFEALVQSLRPLLENPRARKELGMFGRDFAEQNFGLPAMAQRAGSRV